VLTGLDLTGRTILVTGCTAGIGFETMRALVAHGAHVVALARSESAARDAGVRAGGATTPISCDLADLASVAAAAAKVRNLGRPLDTIVANAGIMGRSKVERREGVELQFLVNHVAHFLLVTRLADLLPDQTGRVVVVSSSAGVQLAPREGILFDNLDGHQNYRALRFYGQSKLANALFARELSRRLTDRGVAVNALHPGVILSTRLARNMSLPIRLIAGVASHFTKSHAQGAATQVLLAASPLVAGITGQYWADCQVSPGSRFLDDPAMASRLWAATEDIIARSAGAAEWV
jgi:WW domain-containing oxidoreductase